MTVEPAVSVRGKRNLLFVLGLVTFLLVPPFARGQQDKLGSFFNRLFDRNVPTPTPAPPSKPIYPVIDVTGDINERPGLYNFIAPDGYTVRDLLDAIETAKRDPYVEGLVVYIEEPDLGWARTEQLRRAILDFQSTGRKAYAYLESEETEGYILASACKKIIMPEPSILFLTGIRADLYFLRDLLDKVGVKADVVAIGRYKDAMEMFTQNQMTDPTREMLTSIVDDLTSQSAALVARSRGMTTDRARQLLEGGPYTAAQAKDLGLIDEVEYYDQATSDLESEVGHPIDIQFDYGEEQSSAPEINLMTLFRDLMEGKGKKGVSEKPYIALVYAVGDIVSGSAGDYPLSENVIAEDDFIQMLDDIENDDQAKAVVLRIDSPGGSAEAADLIWNRLKLLDETVPIVVSMGDMAASGGYYIATPADRIFAERGTLTGSIGVIGAKPVLEELYKKIGIHTQSIGGGKYADLMSEARPWNDDERAKMRSLMEDTYKRFVRKVAEGRGMTVAEVDEVAQGRVWTGRQAMERKLVDNIGGIDAAIAEAKKLAGFKPGEKVDIVVYPKQVGLAEYLSRAFGMGTARASGVALSRPEGAGRFARGRTEPGSSVLLAAVNDSKKQAALLAGLAGMLPGPARQAVTFSDLMRKDHFLARAPYELRIH